MDKDTSDQDLEVNVDEKTPTSSGQNQQGSDWEARYKGLQRALDRKTREYDQLSEKYESLITEHEQAKQELRKITGERDESKNSLQALVNEKNKIESDLNSERTLVERTRLIMSEFADLATFETSGLLPHAQTVDELKQKLGAFREALGKSVSRGTQEKLLGYTPPSGSNNSQPLQPTKESVYAEMTRLAGTRDPEQRKRYVELLNTWDELNK